jgi:hypothetical protein
LLSKITAPVRNVSGNFILMQDYLHDDYFKYMEAWVGCPFDYVQFQLPEMDEKIALSWHLTNKEKLFLRQAVFTEDNLAALDRIGKLLNYDVPVKSIAERHQ